MKWGKNAHEKEQIIRLDHWTPLLSMSQGGRLVEIDTRLEAKRES